VCRRAGRKRFVFKPKELTNEQDDDDEFRRREKPYFGAPIVCFALLKTSFRKAHTNGTWMMMKNPQRTHRKRNDQPALFISSPFLFTAAFESRSRQIKCARFPMIFSHFTPTLNFISMLLSVFLYLLCSSLFLHYATDER